MVSLPLPLLTLCFVIPLHFLVSPFTFPIVPPVPICLFSTLLLPLYSLFPLLPYLSYSTCFPLFSFPSYHSLYVLSFSFSDLVMLTVFTLLLFPPSVFSLSFFYSILLFCVYFFLFWVMLFIHTPQPSFCSFWWGFGGNCGVGYF